MLNDDFKRETKIYWLNWKELQVKADLDGDDTLYDRTAEIARMIKGKCGDGNFLDWTNEELLEERLWDMAVLYHIRNKDWKWNDMVRDLLQISRENPDIIFMLVFIESDVSEKTFMHAGRFTTILIDLSEDRLVECFNYPEN